MNFYSEELKYLKHVLSTTSSYTIARGEQIDFSGVKHKKLKEKNRDAMSSNVSMRSCYVRRTKLF